MSKDPVTPAQLPVSKDPVHQVILPFKDQKLADAVKKQLSELCNKIDHSTQPVFKTLKISDDLKMHETKLPLVNQCVVYNYKCDLCDAEYVGFTSWQLHQYIDEHRFSVIGKHLGNFHKVNIIGDLTNNFSVLN